jgi:hypothetical protein
MRPILLAVMLGMLAPTGALAQTDDYQLRLLFHKQVVMGNEQGLAFWANLPDITQTEPHRGVLLGGWLHKDATSWQEVLVGVFVTSDGQTKPLLDMRLYSQNKRVDLFSELMVRADQAIIQAFVTTPLPVAKLRVGLEWELVAPIKDGLKSKALMGPRVGTKIPKIPWLQVATTCYFDLRGGIVVRTYILANR